MILPRPGIKVKMWTGGYTNQPSVDAPWLLKLISVFAIFSIVGAILYAVATSIGGPTIGPASREYAIYISVLHFVVPIALIYTVATNSSVSRVLILGYFLALCISTIGGKGYLGGLNVDPELKAIVSISVLLAITLWLFVNPKMRFYYALISGRPVPNDLESRAATYMDDSKLNPRWRVALDWVADHLETTVLLGFIALAIYAYVSTG